MTPEVKSLISSIRAGAGAESVIPAAPAASQKQTGPIVPPTGLPNPPQAPVAPAKVQPTPTAQLRLGPLDYHPAVGFHVKVL